MKSKLTLLFAAAALALLPGCAWGGANLTHLWKEIRGVGVPYKSGGRGKVILRGELRSEGRVWMPTGTVLYLSKPWLRSGYSAVYAYRTPFTTTKWPCTAEAVDKGLVYFSYAVIPKGKGPRRANVAEKWEGMPGDGKTLVPAR